MPSPIVPANTDKSLAAKEQSEASYGPLVLTLCADNGLRTDENRQKEEETKQERLHRRTTQISHCLLQAELHKSKSLLITVHRTGRQLSSGAAELQLANV